MIAVLDTSAAVRVVLNQPGGADFRERISQAETVLAPELIVAELTNTFWKYFRSNVLSREESEHGLRACLDLVDDFAPLPPLSVEALDLAMSNGRPAYDMFYLVLTRRTGAVLLTADESLRQSADSLGIRTGRQNS